MKHVLLALVLASSADGDQQTAQTRPGLGEGGRAGAAIEGTWRADYDNYWTRNNTERWISIQLQRDGNHNTNGMGISESDVPALSDRRATGPITFTLQRDAGTIDFTGHAADGRARGDFRFTPNADFVSGMGRLGYASLSGEDVWRFAMHDVGRDYVANFRTAGYQLDTSDLIKSRIHGATPAFAEQVKEQGLGRPDIAALVKMRIHGVTAEFIKAMRDLGYRDLPIEQLVKLRIHGVTPDYVRGMTALGFKDQSLDDLVRFRIHGVSSDFIKAFSDLGYKNLDAEDLVKMRIHGVTAQFVRDLAALGYKDLRIEELVKLKIHGVTPEYIKQMRDAGYPNIKVDRLVQFRIHRVDPELVRRAKAHGFNDLSAEDLVDLAIHGRRWLKGRRGTGSPGFPLPASGLAVAVDVHYAGACSSSSPTASAAPAPLRCRSPVPSCSSC